MQKGSIPETDKDECVILLTEGKDAYHLDILNILFLPLNSIYRFRYRQEYVSDSTMKKLNNHHTLDEKIGFVILYRLEDNHEYCFPIRKIKIRKIKLSGGFIYIEFQSLEFIDYENDQQRVAKIITEIKQNFAKTKKYLYSTKSSNFGTKQTSYSDANEEKKWFMIINKISNLPDFERDVFLRLHRIVDTNRGKECKVESNTGAYKVSGSRNYEIEVTQSVSDKTKGMDIIDKGVAITPGAPDSHITFITKEATVLSRYDLLKILFRTKKRVKGIRTILTLSPDKEQISEAKSTKVIPTAMAEPKIDFDITISREVWWIMTVIAVGLFTAGLGASYAGNNFVLDKTILGSLLSTVGAILSAYLGVRYLSDE